MRIALVHDQLQEFGGAERVLVSLKKIFPEADVITAFYNPETLGIHRELVANWNIKTSWFQRVLFLKKWYSPLRFLTPLIWESMDLSAYDLVISSSGTMMCKGVITKPQTVHICYLHHPPRYLYYYETAVEWQKHTLIKAYGNLINHGLRQFDFLSSERVDYFVANSEETRKRIQKFYRKDGVVIYPPVEIPEKKPEILPKKERSYYLTVSRIAKAKHVEVLIDAANKGGFELKIVGSGRSLESLKQMAGKTVTFMENVKDEELNELFKHAKAFLFASRDEEFGIAPIEAMGRGLPVVAYASGGLVETVVPEKNGYLYDELSGDSLLKELEKLENLSEKEYQKMCESARAESEKYSFEAFKKQITSYVTKVTSQKKNA